MQYRVKTGGADTKLWDSKGRVIGDLNVGDTFTGVRSGIYVYFPNGNYTKTVWLEEIATPPVTPPEEEPPVEPEYPDYIVAHWVGGRTARYIPE